MNRKTAERPLYIGLNKALKVLLDGIYCMWVGMSFYSGETAVFGGVDGGLTVFGKCIAFLYNSYTHKLSVY